jgi:hypothetical protein
VRGAIVGNTNGESVDNLAPRLSERTGNIDHLHSILGTCFTFEYDDLRGPTVSCEIVDTP